MECFFLFELREDPESTYNLRTRLPLYMPRVHVRTSNNGTNHQNRPHEKKSKSVSIQTPKNPQHIKMCSEKEKNQESLLVFVVFFRDDPFGLFGLVIPFRVSNWFTFFLQEMLLPTTKQIGNPFNNGDWCMFASRDQERVKRIQR
jgi:hypothetical protein